MSLKYTGYNTSCITMKIKKDEEIVAGDLAVIGAAGELVKANTGDKFVGVVVATNGNFATVQTNGYVELGYGSTDTFSYGPLRLIAGANGVSVDSTTAHGNYVRTVIMIDSANKRVGVIL